MKKTILAMLIVVMTFSATAQTSDTVKSANGTVYIININQPPKKPLQPKKPQSPSTSPEKSVNEFNFTFMQEKEDGLVSKNGLTWWVIILSLGGMALLVAVLFLIALVFRMRRNNTGGNVQHGGSVNHNHNGVVEHHHFHHDEPTIIFL